MKISHTRQSWRPWIDAVVAHDRVGNLPLQNMLFRLCFSILSDDRLTSFAEFKALLWPGCTSGENLDQRARGTQDSSPQVRAAIGLNGRLQEKLRKALLAVGIDSFDRYPHRPEFFAFQFAGGQFGSSAEGRWKFRYLYPGNPPFPGRTNTLDGRKHGLHFTQTAGMTCVHPIVDELLPHYPCVLYTLRARSYLQFGYDPDHYFCRSGHDELGFVPRLNQKGGPGRRSAGSRTTRL